MQNTRQRILDFLDDNYQATALELSHVFDMTPANVRHHLNVLEVDNKIEVVGRSEADGRGRPNLIYMPTKQSQEKGLVNLSTALINTITDHRSKKQKEIQLKKLASQLGAKESSNDQSITLRLGTAVQRLNELGYKSHWEAHSDSPRIYLGNCPYPELADQKTDLCEMDTYLIEDLLDTEVKMLDKCSRNPGDSNHCIFKVLS